MDLYSRSSALVGTVSQPRKGILIVFTQIVGLLPSFQQWPIAAARNFFSGIMS